MSKINPKAMVKSVEMWGKKRSPEILTGIGIAGMITTTVMAVKATPKALVLIEEEKRRQNQKLLKDAKKNGDECCDRIEKLHPVEAIKATWKCYIPAAVTGAMSVMCLVGASSVSARRNAALATAYTLSESAMKEYRTKVIETVGEKKEQVVKDAIAKDKVEQNPVTTNEVIITDKGNTLCYEVISGRYFKSDIDRIKKAVNEINRRLLLDSYISLNEFYYAIGLDETKIGDDLGWNISQSLIELSFSSQLASDGTPCVVLDYDTMPQYNFDKWF